MENRLLQVFGAALQRHLDLMEEKLALEKYQAGLDPRIKLSDTSSDAAPTASKHVTPKLDQAPADSSGIVADKLDTSIYIGPETENSAYDVTEELDPTKLIYP